MTFKVRKGIRNKSFSKALSLSGAREPIKEARSAVPVRRSPK